MKRLPSIVRPLARTAAIAALSPATLLALPAASPARAAVRANAAGNQIARVRYIYRGLSVLPPSQPLRAAALNMPLFEQYALRTTHNQKASIGFRDGTALHINQDTDLVLASPHVTKVRQGEVAEYLAPGTNHQVQTATAVAGAIGTAFDVDVVGNKTVLVVLHGALQVRNDDGSVVVKNNHETVVTPNHAPTPPASVDAKAVFAWTDGIPTPDLGEDVALDASGGTIVGFSSQREGPGDAGHVQHINDGLLTQGWESASGQVTDQWVKVGFFGGNSYTISGVIIDPAATSGDPSAADLKDFEIRVSSTGTDDASFATVYTGTCRREDTLQHFVFPVPVHAKYVELYMRNNYGDPTRLAVAELEVVATSALFAEPSTVAVGPQGSVYVADTVNNRIQKLSAAGKALGHWGSKGTKKGQFLEPAAVAVDRAGNLYVADTDNDRIQKLSPDGKVAAVWGTYGTHSGQFFAPQGVAVDRQGNVYVADTYNHRIQKLSPSGKVLDVWGTYGSAPGQFYDPTGIALDSRGNIYVADENNNRIQKLGPQGNVIRVWGSQGSGAGQLNEPSGVAVDPYGNVYVTDQFNGRVEKFSPDGGFLATWGKFGSGPGQFRLPWGPAVDQEGDLYVADRFNGRVQKLSPAGKVLAIWGKFATIPQILGQPGGLGLDPQGNIDVVDRTNDRVQQRDPTGHVRAVWGYHGEWTFEPARGLGQFWYPLGIAVNAQGAIYVSDTLNSRIQELSQRGPIDTFGSFGSAPGQLRLPWGVAVDKQGDIYVADSGNHRVEEFSPQKQLVREWGSLGSGPGQLNSPTGITVDAQGTVYVADTQNHRIEMFSPSGTFLRQYGPVLPGYGRLFLPDALATDASGDLYIGDEHMIVKVSPLGKVLQTFALSAQNSGSAGVVAGIIVDSGGNLYVTDMQNSRILKLSASGKVLAIWS